MKLAGSYVRRLIEKRAALLAQDTEGVRDPDVSVVIRSRNDGAYVQQLFADLRAQKFNGKIEVIVVDTESRDDTVAYARSQGATIIQLKQTEFTYPHALNLGFQAAKYPYVVTLVGHSSLSNRMMLKALTYWSQRENFGGMYSFPLPNSNSTFWDRLGANTWLAYLFKKPLVLQRSSPGMLAANCSIVKRSVWEALGGYDERYAGGGEDVALARSMLAGGYLIVREPLCSVYHSHGLNLRDTFKQQWHWIQIGQAKPQPFDTQKIHARRPDLR